MSALPAMSAWLPMQARVATTRADVAAAARADVIPRSTPGRAAARAARVRGNVSAAAVQTKRPAAIVANAKTFDTSGG